jgi:hypothetical protein
MTTATALDSSAVTSRQTGRRPSFIAAAASLVAIFAGGRALLTRWARYSAWLLCAALATGLTGCTATSNDSPAPRATSTAATTPPPATVSPTNTKAPSMRIHLTIGDTVLPATLDDTPASRDFAALLPLTVTLSDYAGTEKISDLPRKLSTADAPAGTDAAAGDITYYAPWGNLAIFYKGSGYASGLVKLGSIASGVEALANQQGSFTATIDHAD